MKKILSCLLICILAIPVLSGCQSDKKTGAKNVKTVSIWSGNSSSKNIDTKIFAEWNNTVGKEKGIYIDYQVKSGDSINQEIDLALQNGEAPDMFPSSFLEKNVDLGYVAPINDLPGGEEFIKKYDGILLKRRNIVHGKVYNVPVGGGTQGLIYNKELFKKAGIVDGKGNAKPPQTWDELKEDAKILTDASKQQFGIIFPLKWTGVVVSDMQCPMMSSCGHFGYNPVTDKYDFSALAPIMQKFLDMKKDGSIYPGAEGLDNDSARALFATGKIGMKFAFSFDVGVLNDQFPAECDWGVAPYPTLDKDVRYKQRMAYGYSYSINAKSIDKLGGDTIMEVLKFITGEEYRIKSGAYPYKIDDVSKIKTTPENEAKHGWKEFAKITSISSCEPFEPLIDRGSDSNITTRFIEQVWTGLKTPEQVCKEYDTAMETARKRYYDTHPDEDIHEAANPNWDIRLK